MSRFWNGWIFLSALAVATIGTFIWKKSKRTRIYKKVGNVSKIYFYPVKSLKGIVVTEGICTKLGLEVNGLLDRSFMLISENVLLSQRQSPTLTLLSTQIVGDKLIISGPGVDPLTVDIQAEPNPNDAIIECQVHADIASVIDCGESAAQWFQNYLQKPDIRLVRHFPEFPKRKYTKNIPFFENMKIKNPVVLQDFSAFHILSQPSIDDLNERIGERKTSVLNFRPNILVEGCPAYAEDTWKYMKFNSGAEMFTVLPVTRCLMTTIEPETGILTPKEPLTTLRKYRIPKDPEILKITGSIPCIGTACFVSRIGQIMLNDDIFASVSQ